MPAETVILVERRSRPEKSRLKELRSLAETLNYQIAGELTQLQYPRGQFHIGSGKAKELAQMVKSTGATLIIFENELKSTQAYNLAKVTGVRVIDKFQLILEVFSKRASTREANLQIELARLRYEIPRAREKVRLVKRGEQPGFHGLGVYEADVYFEALRRQAIHIQEKLRRIRLEKQARRIAREEIGLPLVSICGYTMAGKSALFNVLSEGNVEVSPGPFTTLSTKCRVVDFFGKKALLSDTVGFIDNLNLTLMDAFKSTLDETIHATLLLLIVDCSESLSEIQRKLRSCLVTLREIGALAKPTLTILNKVDLISEPQLNSVVSGIQDVTMDMISISALKGINIEALKERVSKKLADYVRASFELPLTSESMSLISSVRNMSTVLDQQFEGKTVTVTLLAVDYLVDKIKNRIHNAGGHIIEAARV